MKFRERTGSVVAWCALTGHVQPWWQSLVAEVQARCIETAFFAEDEHRCSLTGRIVRGWDIAHIDRVVGTFTVTK